MKILEKMRKNYFRSVFSKNLKNNLRNRFTGFKKPECFSIEIRKAPGEWSGKYKGCSISKFPYFFHTKEATLQVVY